MNIISLDTWQCEVKKKKRVKEHLVSNIDARKKSGTVLMLTS